MGLPLGWQNFIPPLRSPHMPLPRDSVEVDHAWLPRVTHGQEKQVEETTFSQPQWALQAVLPLWALNKKAEANSGLPLTFGLDQHV